MCCVTDYVFINGKNYDRCTANNTIYDIHVMTDAKSVVVSGNNGSNISYSSIPSFDNSKEEFHPKGLSS